jgi:triacylglycerol esterase/lipase EstA (alpha/beta hydrolase family)
VLFFHGLWMTGVESFLLRRRLARQGWAMQTFAYSSLREPLEKVIQRGARRALQLAQETSAPVHLLGHSLGGLVICRMFEQGLLDFEHFQSNQCRVVLMGSPLQGSQSGRQLHRLGNGLLLGESTDELSQPHRMGDEQRRWTFGPQLGVIAGSMPVGLGRLLGSLPEPNDGTVSLLETHIDGATDRCLVSATHTGLLTSVEAAHQVNAFLEHGRFEGVLRQVESL